MNKLTINPCSACGITGIHACLGAPIATNDLMLIQTLSKKIAELEKTCKSRSDTIIEYSNKIAKLECKVMEYEIALSAPDEIRDLEQQAKVLSEFKFKRCHTLTILENLCDGSYSQEDHDLVYEELKYVEIILSNAANELTGQANALKEQVK